MTCPLFRFAAVNIFIQGDPQLPILVLTIAYLYLLLTNSILEEQIGSTTPEARTSRSCFMCIMSISAAHELC